MNLESLLVILAGLAGVGSLVAFVVNTLKVAKVVKDGQADIWATGLNLGALVGLFVVKVFFPDVNLSVADEWATKLTELGITATPFILLLMKVISNWSHSKAKGLPLVGKSYS